LCGNTSEPEDAGREPGKSYLFFLTAWPDPGIELVGDRAGTLARALQF